MSGADIVLAKGVISCTSCLSKTPQDAGVNWKSETSLHQLETPFAIDEFRIVLATQRGHKLETVRQGVS